MSCRSTRAHLSERSEGFLQTADVAFVVGESRYLAHSQLLANISNVIHRLLEDFPQYSSQEPLVLSEFLSQHGLAATETFLKHVYKQVQISSLDKAHQLLSVAHMIDAPSLMKQAEEYLGSQIRSSSSQMCT